VERASLTPTEGDMDRDMERDRDERDDWGRDERDRRRPGSAYDDRTRRGVAGPIPGLPEPAHGDGSLLVLTFEGETYEVAQEDFIPEQVFGALETATYPGTDVPVFSQVDTFSVRTDDIGGVPRRVFRGRAVVNLEASAVKPSLAEPAQEAEPGPQATDDGEPQPETGR
jgi:hypothetical protein